MMNVTRLTGDHIPMLTTARAIVLAAVLVSLAAVAHAALPRYEVHTYNAEAGSVLRVDRWRGTAELGGARADLRPAWLAVPASRQAVAAPRPK